MAHGNFSMDRIGERDRQLQDEQQIAELEFWKRRCKDLESEFRNIPKALREYGEWQMTNESGVETHVILDPKHHPEQEAE